MEVLKRHRFTPAKRLGQHFLVDANTVDKILSAADLRRTDVVLEIGPGIGTLTVAMAPLIRYLVAVERDSRLIPILDDTLSGLGNVKVLLADALEFDLRHPPAGIPIPNKFVSNLPYQVATPIIADYIEEYPEIELYIVMVQKEVGDRMLAMPGSKEYGAFSVKIRYFCRAERVMNVSKHVFMPKPEVDSVVIRLARLPKPAVDVHDQGFFLNVVKAAFSQRRKTLKRAISAGLALPAEKVESALKEAGIDPRRRGETLSLEEFAQLSVALLALDGISRDQR
ncbi:MAG: 16S rRNA (adenine(1518)-N(6)/adenine(1519)-N(6))-dimethyltransferase RsmA [Actinobacteria bacterium]|nr:16S rRNA (adenine(1518)-N(6)/adenine(1519)-N(6))-dimethyltransferase RsmA [Actinomycetota bacterium]